MVCVVFSYFFSLSYLFEWFVICYALCRMLMWEDGFCRGSDCLDQMEGEDLVRKAFSKMSIQLYNYGEGWVLGR